MADRRKRPLGEEYYSDEPMLSLLSEEATRLSAQGRVHEATLLHKHIWELRHQVRW